MGNKTFFTYSFGCRVNEAEKEEIDRKMLLNSFKFDNIKPDIYIINTCSVTQKAEREARQLIYRVKKDLPETKIVVTGCSATYWIKHKLYKSLPVDLMIDNVNKEFLVELIKKRLSYKSKAHSRSVLDTPKNKFFDSGRVMIKIQDGCQRFCSFCVVPYLRGNPKSYKINDIVNKINDKVSEVILTAINTEAYGYDTKERFTDLLRTVIDKTDVARVSLGSIHPWSINKNFFDFYKEYLPKNRLVNFFHVPLQSGSDKILSLMKRGYKSEEMQEKLQSINRLNKDALIATDIIVGFLGETDKDFEDTYNFLKDSPISKFHVFRFSKRTKTAADYMAKRLNEPTSNEKYKRSKALIELSQKKQFAFMESNVGRKSSVLFLEKTIGEYREGLLDNQMSVFVPLPLDQWKRQGLIKNVKIVEYKNGRLFGKII